MSQNLSNFPEQIDVFIRHFDIGAIDISNLQRYQTLKVKDSLTSAETQEMSALFSALREKIFLAEDFNKLQDCISNLETFFKYQVETYINEKYSIWENKTNEKLKELNNTISTANGWISEQMASLHDSTYFNFDNMSYRNGFTVVIEKSNSNWSEILKTTADNAVYATRTTVKNAKNNYTITTVCNKVVPKIHITEHIYKNSEGKWITDIT